ncbi:alkaline phosphatase [Cohaesibacter marisflavi]|uniref:Alkaline phosphatase n=1 Tax=Cohaesibacter marisflavi TaxID=655353 RepID=A0A1I5HWS8_9HYPH|nr:alkaline phosphatase [Cohaesibacter marisflavi]SFO52745.1 alkaline phosphatase [Cohaesibacter marisflavi]
MKKSILVAASLLLTSSVAFAADFKQADNQWFKDAQASIKARMAVQPITNKAKNIILLIADGNGVGSNYATRLYAGQQAGKLGSEHVLPQDALPHVALVKTYNTNAQTPDSAGTGTAFHTGVKTKAGVLGVDETLARGDCSAVEGATVTNAVETFSAMGKQIGVISTARLTHATPASAYAHSADRNFEADSYLPEGCGQKDIAVQLIDVMKSGAVDIAMGGGRRNFITKETKGDEGKSGKRTDGKNLIEEAKAAGIQYIWDDKTFASADWSKPVLGLFESSHMKYEADRTGEPSLAEMTEASIKALGGSENGYFLTIEAGRVDHANHAGNAARTVTDGVAFAEAIAKAVEMTDPQETLIVVTADHEHAIAFNGYCGRGSDVLGLCYDIDPAGTKHSDKPLMGKDGKPYTVVGFLNGPGSILGEDGSGSRPEVTQEQATDIDYVQQSLIPLSSESHSGEDVAVYGRGPWSHLFDSTIEQNEIFHVMLQAATAE